ncbi:MAG: response regulator [Proteobacteria bacterium]|nr:response regulator [Pseudomonadota bacterium]
MKWALRQKVNVAILITFLLIAAIFSVIQLPFQQRSMQSAMKQNEMLLKLMVDRDQESLANEIFEDRKRAMAIRLGQMSRVEGILNIAVYDKAGKLLINEGKNPHISELTPENLPQPLAINLIRQDQLDKTRILVFVQAIEIVGERIGFIRIDYSLAEIERQQRQSYLIFGGLLGFIFIIMLVLLNYILSQVVIHPISSLRDAMLRMKRGALGDQLVVSSEDEVGELTTAFNRMSADLADSYRQIESQNSDLRESEKRLSDERERLAQMRVYLKNIFDSMPSILVSVGDTGIVVEWNEAAYRATGMPSTEAVGQEIWKILPLMEKYREHIHEVFTTRVPKEFHREAIGAGEGEEFHNISFFPLVANCVQGIVIRIDNVTELENKEQQLRHAQKMETIGTLAGGLAHDFNNILGGLTGSLSLIRFKLEQDTEFDRDFLRKYLGIMEQAGKRAGDLVKQLLSIVRKQEMNFQPVDLNTTIDHILKICTISFDKCIDLNFSNYTEKAMINADPTQTEQVLLNLCVNASHAMTTMRKTDERQGGKLMVWLEKIFADQNFRVTHLEAKPISYWVLSVQDTGVGMETKTVAKIFDPFFTTKAKDKGTGLGLAMVYNIVQQHGGFIDVYSELGLGSTFSAYFPVYLDASTQIKSDMGAVELIMGKGLVLVVDDEAMIRNTAKEILETCGYSVILATDGQEGLDIFRLRHQEISVVLLDMLMPKMSGKETYMEIKKINPNLKVLFSSGFKQDERVEEVLQLGVQGFVQKPYTLHVLSSAIDKVINS